MPVSGKNFNPTESSISTFFQETVRRFCAKSEVHNGWECTILSRARRSKNQSTLKGSEVRAKN